jgi:hypothetical protein
MAVRTRIPIEKTKEGIEKEARESIDRLQKERYNTPIYEIGMITKLISRSTDPNKNDDIERKIMVQPYSFDKNKLIGIGPSSKEELDLGHEDITSYIIGVRRDFDLSNMLKNGDIVEIEIVSNEITKRNGIDGYYRSTIKDTENFGDYIEGFLFPAVELFKDAKNALTNQEVEEVEITEDILNTKKEVDSYKGGRYKGKIEVITLEGKDVEINTAKKYIEMKNAASKEGIRLGITSGYRSMESQTSIYNNRYEPDYQGSGTCRKKGENVSGTFEQAKKVSSKGVAAYPGCSNHQNGKALDLWNSPSNVAWLRVNASRFGFYNTVSSENWHWEYLG